MDQNDKTVMDTALGILYDNRIAISDMDEVREAILARDEKAALTALMRGHGLSPDEAESVHAYLRPRMTGKKVAFVEIDISEISFPTEDECVPEEDSDPLAKPVTYYARRGHVIAEMVTTSSTAADGTWVNKVFHAGELVYPHQMDQVWRVDTVGDGGAAEE